MAGFPGAGNGERVLNWDVIRTWVAIILLLDASFGLWNHERFKESLPKINIVRIALLEGLAALILLLVPYLF